MAIAITLKDYLETEGVSYDLVEHPYTVSSMRTAQEAHVPGEDVAKAVVLHDGEGYIMAVVPATHHIQLGKLRKKYQKVLSLAQEKDLHGLFTDCSVGAIPPIGKAYDMDVIFDEHLNDCEDVYFEAGDHTDLVHVTGKDFRMLMGNASHGEFSRHM